MNTSARAYKKLKGSGAIADRKELVLRFFREIGGSGTSYDIIRHTESSTEFNDGESRYRFQQNILATVSDLNKDGLLKCTGEQINPSSGASVKFYEINQGDVVALPTVEKGYKKLYEEVRKELDIKTKLLAEAEASIEAYQTDSIQLEKLSEVYYDLREKGTPELIQKLWFRDNKR